MSASADQRLLDAASPALRAAILALVHEPQDERVPTLLGARSGALARLLYRLSLDPRHDPPPLVCAQRRHLAGASPDWWHAARAGWLCIDTAQLPAELEEPHGRGAFMRVLREDGSSLLPATDPGWLDQLHRLDQLHAVSVDAALAATRRHLLARCAQREPLLIQSEPGCGAEQLVALAHAALSAQPLATLAAAQPAPRPHEWAICPAPLDLDAAGWAALRDRLREPTRAARRAPARHTRPSHPAFAQLAGRSEALCAAIERALLLAPHKLPVLITGEPGVGKEVFARAIHAASGRKGPFVALDMGALSEQIAESELFGHRRGAFTGADRDRIGAIRSAEGGTLLLDEIGNLSLGLQAKLLRVLQEQQVRPVGEDRAVSIDVRIIAATNADLDELARRGLFRQDLLGRLRGAALELLPLRERLDDLPALIAALLPERALTPAAHDALSAHTWPGNVRELAHTLTAAALLSGPDGPIDAPALGLGAERGPTIVLHSSDLALSGAELPAALALRLSAAPLRLPALRERPASSRRALVLGALWGRPVSAAALRLLVEHPWWGNMIELEACARLLDGLLPGPIDLDALRAELPQLAPPSSVAPLHVLMSPALVGPGQVGGLSWELDAGELLIGRAQSVHELDLAARRGDRRAARWLDVIRARCTAPPACLAMTHLRQISRAHLLVTRAEGGLAVEVLPETGLEVRCAALGEPPLALPPGERRLVGVGAELWIIAPGAAKPDLQLFVFAGRATAVAMGLDALAAAARLHDPTLATAHESAPQPDPGGDQATLRWRVWPLTLAEAEVMVDLLASYQGGQLKHHLLATLAGADAPDVARLADFLRGVPRLSQYLVRLLSLPDNAHVLSALAARYDASADGALRRSLLPRGLQELL